jgi:hypothetical protein
LALLRTARDGASRVLCLHNVSVHRQTWTIATSKLDAGIGAWRDLLSGTEHDVAQGRLAIDLAPYQVCWLKMRDSEARAAGAKGGGTG